MASIDYPFKGSVSRKKSEDGSEREYLRVSDGVFLGVDGHPFRHVALGGTEYDITDLVSGCVAIRVPFSVFFPWGKNVPLPEYEGSLAGEPYMPSQSEMNSYFANVLVAGHRSGNEKPTLVFGAVEKMKNANGVLYFPVALFARGGDGSVSLTQVLKSDFCFPLQRNYGGYYGWDADGVYATKNFCSEDFEHSNDHAWRVSAEIKDGALKVKMSPGCVFFGSSAPSMKQFRSREFSVPAQAGTYYVAIDAGLERESWHLEGVFFEEGNFNKWCNTLVASAADISLENTLTTTVAGRSLDESSGTGSSATGRQFFALASVTVEETDSGDFFARVVQFRHSDLFVPSILSAL